MILRSKEIQLTPTQDDKNLNTKNINAMMYLEKPLTILATSALLFVLLDWMSFLYEVL